MIMPAYDDLFLTLGPTLARCWQFLIPVLRFLFVAPLALCGLSVAYVLYTLICRRISTYRSLMRNVPGPDNANWLIGNFIDVVEPDSTRLKEEWVRKYGHVLKFHSLFYSHKLLAVDPVAISHVLQHSDTFQKFAILPFKLDVIFGRGVLLVEGQQHRKQRKVMNPAFSPAQVRKFTSVFLEKSLELRDIWVDLLFKSSRKDGKLGLDAFSWLNKVSLDIIGLTGFNYAFNSLHSPDEKRDELYGAICSVSMAGPSGFIFVLQLFFPLFRHISTHRSRALARGVEKVRQICSELIKDRKKAVLDEHNANGSGAVGKQDVQGHDLLSLLIKSNIAADMPESMRMDDSEILSQIPTFLIAGHETSSTAISWTLFALSCQPAVQAKLRAELRTCPTDSPTMDQLNALPYLEAVVREALRLYTPVYTTQRIAMHDAAIPLQKPFTDKNGVLQSTVRVSKGDFVSIPICLLNRSTEIWGEDANEFKPERWEDVPEAVKGLPSVYGHLLTFIAGAHACIGFRFSVVEIKALLFTLVRGFEFEMALSAEEIVRKTAVVGRPVIASNPSAGPQLPLLIRLANTD